MFPRLISGQLKRNGNAGNKRAFAALVRRGARPGVIAYLDGAPAGWCAVGPRRAFKRIEQSRLFAPIDDRPVWSVVCFYIAPRARRSGMTEQLLRSAVRLARAAGAAIVEGYPVDATDRDASGSLWHGTLSVFLRAGFKEVARRTPRRPIVRKVLRRA